MSMFFFQRHTFFFTVLSVALCMTSISTYAAEVHQARPHSSSAVKSNLPNCVNDPAVLEQIEQSRKENSKSASKYKAIEIALKTDSDDELVQRLIYAETRGAHCPDRNPEIAKVIAKVIQNRIVKRKGSVKSVVFQRDQFASSLNGYAESEWREFLCPSDERVWLAARAARLASLEPLKGPNKGEPATSNAATSSAFNYYLYRHSSRFSPPTWANVEPIAFPNSDKIADCIKIFKGDFK